MPSRNKAEMAKRVAKSLDRPVTEVAAVIDAFLEQIVRELASGNDVKLTGYFSIGTAVRQPRKARHPRTGEPIDVPARTKVTFSTGAKVKRWVETRLEKKHFYGKERDTESIERGTLQVESGEIAEALDVLPDEAKDE